MPDAEADAGPPAPREAIDPGARWRGWHGDEVPRRVPFTLRRRVNWGDGDAAQIAYTGRFVDMALDAADCWWEAVLEINWFGLRQDERGSPLVAMAFEFHRPIVPGDRLDLRVRIDKMTRSTLTYEVIGAKVGAPADRADCFTARLTSCHIDRRTMRSAPFPDDYRQRVAAYRQACALADEGIVGPDEVLRFWFARDVPGATNDYRPLWFGGDELVPREAMDAAIADRFAATHAAAIAGRLDHWRARPASCLALILVLDQFARHLFRGRPEAFAHDALALEIAEQAIAKGYDRAFVRVERMFFYLPFEHAEDLAVQQRSLALFEQFAGLRDSERALVAVRRHLEIIERFGRFPHRNDVLGRASTPEEVEFLKEPNSSF